MNKLSTSIFIISLFATSLLQAQVNKTTALGYIDFEHADPFQGSGFWVYWLSIPPGNNNVWQIGKPQKTIFTAANSVPNVIVTDTVNSYPVNDTSRFIIGQWVNVPDFPARYIRGKYNVYSDTLSDYGLMEVSVDNGATWINVLTDTMYGFFDQPMYTRPVLSGNSGGWKDFNVHLSGVCDSFHLGTQDTLLMRFSFISDGIQTNKDGLMYDDIYLFDYAESITDANGHSKNTTSAYPNPATDQLFIQSNTTYKQATVQLYNTLGSCTGSYSFTNSELMKLQLDGYAPGLYYYRVVYDGVGVSEGKFVVER